MRHSLDAIHGARADYAEGKMSTRDIGRKHGMSQDSLYYWVDGGPPDGDRHLEPIPRRRGGVGRIARRRRLRGDRADIIRRMWRTAEAQVRDIEDRLTQDKQAPDERERDARSLAILVKTLRELSAMDESRDDKATTTDTSDDDEIPRDIDEFRRELARRIHAFVDDRTGARVSDP